MNKTMMAVCGVAMAVVLSGGRARAQGSLTPPGAPEPVMRTLDQVEPRTLIEDLPFTISQPGSYYLARNLTGPAGITVTSSNVCIDLNGFSLTYTGSARGMIGINGATANNVTIRNGLIQKWIGAGVQLGPVAHVEDVNVEACAGGGISVGEQSHLLRCRTGNCGLVGIAAGNFSQVEDCRSVVSGTDGITAGLGCQVRRCITTHNSGDGIRVSDRCIVAGNIANYNGRGGTGACIRATGSENRIEGNGLFASVKGLDIDGSGNYVAGNTVKGNTDNYEFAAGNQLNLLLCQIPETLDWPCSVTLAGTLSTDQEGVNGITVNADFVTIDLGGHALIGPGTNSYHGICQSSQTGKGLVVRNGKLSGWSRTTLVSSYYVAGLTAKGVGTLVTDVQASGNHYGIFVGSGSVLERCEALHNTGFGINASRGTLTHCAAINNGGAGISAAGLIADCTASGNDRGIVAQPGSRVRDCSAQYNTAAGISVQSRASVSGCFCFNNGDGISVTGTGNRIEGNSATGNDNAGISISGTGNLVVRNSASQNTVADFTIGAGNDAGTVQTSPVGAGAWDNFQF